MFNRMRSRALTGREPTREADVLAHLRLLLNVRRGASALDAEYGLPDLTDLAHRIPEGLPMLQRILSETIARHEPRLRNVIVRGLPSPADAPQLRFEVLAALSDGAPLRFQTVLSHGGQVSVR
jgi:type VI secretion system protein